MTVSRISTVLIHAKLYRVMRLNRKRSLSLNQLTILFLLEDIKVSEHLELSVGELAKKIDVTASAVSQILKRLEEQKLIRKYIVPTKQRGRPNTVPRITKQGSAVVASFMK